MSDRTFKIFITLIGAVCGYVVIKRFLAADSLILRNALIQGFFVGFGLAVVTIEIVARIKIERINGWVTAFGCGLPGNGMFTRAAHTRIFPGPINVPQEAMYWRTNVDGAGHTLSGEHDYIMHFPPGGLPPNDAFWSLTMADAKERFVANPLNRYLVGDRSGLASKRGRLSWTSISKTPPRRGMNPTGYPRLRATSELWLRAYMPGAAVLDGKYTVPPVVRTQ